MVQFSINLCWHIVHIIETLNDISRNFSIAIYFYLNLTVLYKYTIIWIYNFKWYSIPRELQSSFRKKPHRLILCCREANYHWLYKYIIKKQILIKTVAFNTINALNTETMIYTTHGRRNDCGVILRCYLSYCYLRSINADIDGVNVNVNYMAIIQQLLRALYCKSLRTPTDSPTRPSRNQTSITIGAVNVIFAIAWLFVILI